MRVSVVAEKAASAGLAIAVQQEDEAKRALRTAEAELAAAQAEERARQERLAAAPAAKKKKAGALRGLGGLLKRKKGVADVAGEVTGTDDAARVDTTELEGKVRKFQQITTAMTEARVVAEEQAARIREEHAKGEAEAKAKAETKAKAEAKAKADAKAKAEGEAKAKAEAEARAEAEAKAEAKRLINGDAQLTDAAPPVDSPPADLGPPGEEDLEYDDDEGDELGFYPAEDEDDDVDSDFDLPIGVAEPTEPPLLRDLLLVAKLYGHDALVEPPPDDIEWDLKDVSLHADGTLWHVEDDLVGMLDLQNVVAQGYTAGTSDEICLSQAGKCHLLRIGEGGKVPLKDWSDAVARFVPR